MTQRTKRMIDPDPDAGNAYLAANRHRIPAATTGYPRRFADGITSSHEMSLFGRKFQGATAQAYYPDRPDNRIQEAAGEAWTYGRSDHHDQDGPGVDASDLPAFNASIVSWFGDVVGTRHESKVCADIGEVYYHLGYDGWALYFLARALDTGRYGRAGSHDSVVECLLLDPDPLRFLVGNFPDFDPADLPSTLDDEDKAPNLVDIFGPPAAA